MAIKASHLHERVARLEANMESIIASLQEIKQDIRQGLRDLNQRIDKLILYGCSTILGSFVALSVQLWLKR